MKKRVFGLALALVLVLTSLTVCASVSAQEKDVVVTVGSVTGKVGDIVEVPVSISEGSYLVNADIVVTYDPTVFEPVHTYYTDSEGESYCYQVNDEMFNGHWMYIGKANQAGRVVFSMATGSSTGFATGGEMFRLAFKIIAPSYNGKITFEAGPFCGNDGTGETDTNGYPKDYDLNYTVVGGDVTAKPNGLIGDMNGDGILNTVDALLHYACTNGVREFTVAQQQLADYNENGTVDMMDTLLLFRHASGF